MQCSSGETKHNNLVSVLHVFAKPPHKRWIGWPAVYGNAANSKLQVIFDSAFKLHVSEVSKVSHYHLRNIASRLQHFLSPADTEVLIQVFFFSGIDDCNSLFPCLPTTIRNRLELVWRCATRVISKLEFVSTWLLRLQYYNDFELNAV